ncbi:MAG: A24 family peptidase [Clostridium sp.]|nr:A24 family peptidase [Clostridium sp.]
MLLVLAGISDARRGRVRNLFPALILALALLSAAGGRTPPAHLLGILLAAPFYGAWLKGGIGGADVKIVAAAGGFLGLRGGCAALLTGLALCIGIESWRRRKKNGGRETFPLIPYLAAGYLAWLFLPAG